MRVKWRLVLPIALGAAVLGSTVYMVNRSHSIFGDQCRTRCAAFGMDYRVRPVPPPVYGVEYPGECVCVPRAAKRWWEIWR